MKRSGKYGFDNVTLVDKMSTVKCVTQQKNAKVIGAPKIL